MVTFHVAGKPRAQGSKVLQSSGGKTWMRESDSSLPAWRDSIRAAAKQAMIVNGQDVPYQEAVSVHVLFIFKRPKTVSVNRAYPNVKPDADKLARAVLDAMTGVCYVDDGRVVDLTVRKAYEQDGGWPEGALVTVESFYNESITPPVPCCNKHVNKPN